MGFLDDYELVEDRLAAFKADWPDGRITTDMIHDGDPDYIVKASVWKRTFLPAAGPGELSWTQPPDATGYAQEIPGSSPVNKTSALENCETSAIGRALANLGYAAKGKRPSREEMSKVSDAVPTRAGTAASDRSGEGSPDPPSTPSPEHHLPTELQGGVGMPNCRHRKGEDGRCVNCGRSWVEIVEGTTADLGS